MKDTQCGADHIDAKYKADYAFFDLHKNTVNSV